MIERALVTGGAGFIGANLVDRLVDDGAEVLVVDDLSRGKLDRLASARGRGHIQIHQLDIRDEAFVEAAVRFAPEVVFHLAAQIDVRYSVEHPFVDASINVAGTVNALAAAVAAGARRLVFASSGGAIFGEAAKLPTPEGSPRHPIAPYGVSKLVVEEYLRYFHESNGLDYVSLGFSNVYGPRQDPHGEAGVVAIFTEALLDRRRPVIFGDGSNSRDYVYVEDVTDACIRAAEYDGVGYFNIGTGVSTSVTDLFSLLHELTGSRIRPVFADARAGEVARSALNSGLASRKLGWQPWTALNDGLRLTVDWFTENRP